MDDIIKENGIGLFAVELKETGEWLGFIGVNIYLKIANTHLRNYHYMKLDGVLFQKYGVTDLPLKVQCTVSICQKGD